MGLSDQSRLDQGFSIDQCTRYLWQSLTSDATRCAIRSDGLGLLGPPVLMRAQLQAVQGTAKWTYQARL